MIDSAPKQSVKGAGKAPASSAAPASPAAGGGLKVGLLLPLSGAHAALGQALQNAAQMAVFDDNGARLELLPRDSGDTPQQAAAALRDLQTRGVSLVVGPLFAPQVAALKPLASKAGLPLLALSNDKSQAAPGTYLLGFAPTAQVMRVSDFACTQGSKAFVALLPSGTYGDVVSQALQTSVQRCSGATLKLRRYDGGGMQLASILQETAGTRQLFDTLVLAEPASQFQGSALPTALDGRHIRLIGTGLWDEDGVGRTAPSLVGGWFAAPSGGDRQRFNRNYLSYYGAPPPRLAALAYDAVALAAVLQKRNLKPEPVNLANPVGYMGVDGIFRLLPDGTVERGLAVSRITPTGRDIIDQAPANFSLRTH